MRTRWPVVASLVVLASLLLAPVVPAAAVPAAVPIAETWIAFSSLEDGYEGIWLVHPDGSGLFRLTQGADVYPTWSPDGSMLAYVHMGTVRDLAFGPHGLITATVGSSIQVVDVSGSLIWTLGTREWAAGMPHWSSKDDCWQPQWSPDGKALTYATRSSLGPSGLWYGRNTFYLSPSPRLVVEEEPHGSFGEPGSVAMSDLSWAPGPAPLWVRSVDDPPSRQLVAWSQPILESAAGTSLHNPRWSPDGRSLTAWQIDGTSGRNALAQLSAAGKPERTLFESGSLVLYNSAEWSPDGQRHLIGVSTDRPAWSLEARLLAGAGAPPISGTAPLTATVLPAEPPPDGYLYVLSRGGGKQAVLAPRAGTLDLIGRQPWSSDGQQVLFVRIPYPGQEQSAPADALGIYAGPPGQVQRIVPFYAIDAHVLAYTYPAWQPAGEARLPTAQPSPALPTAGPAATATPPATPVPTAPPVATATSAPAAASLAPAATVTPTAAPPPPAAAPASPGMDLQTTLVLALVVAAAGAAVFLILRIRRQRQSGDTPPPSASMEKLRGLFASRRARPAGDRPEHEEAGGDQWGGPSELPAGEPVPPAAPGGASAAAFELPAHHWPGISPQHPGPVAGLPPVEEPAVAAEPAPPPAEPAPPPTPAPVQQMLEQGIAMVKSGQYVEALATLRQMTYLDPENPEAWMWLGWAAAKQRDLALAEHSFLQAQKLGYAGQAEKALEWLRKQPARG